MPFRYINDHCWVTAPIQSLRHWDKCIYQYGLINHHQNAHGIFRASPLDIAKDLDMPPKQVKSSLQHLHDLGLIKWIPSTDTIWVKEYITTQPKYNNIFTAIITALRQEPLELAQEYVAYYNDLGLWKKHKIDISEFVKSGAPKPKLQKKKH